MDEDTILACALEVLEAPKPSRLDTYPTEDPKVNVIVQLGGRRFKHDLKLLETCPATLHVLPAYEQLEWAAGVIKKAWTPELKGHSPDSLLRSFLEGFSQGEMPDVRDLY